MHTIIPIDVDLQDPPNLINKMIKKWESGSDVVLAKRENRLNENFLKRISASIPVGLFTCITGVSGSGKSTLINQTLLPISSFILNKSKLSKEIKSLFNKGVSNLISKLLAILVFTGLKLYKSFPL